MRITIKKLRYATEFFDTLFATNKQERKALSKALEKLQSAMSKLNDIRVHESGQRYCLSGNDCKAPRNIASGRSCEEKGSKKHQAALGGGGESRRPIGQTRVILEIKQIGAGAAKWILREHRAMV